MIQTKAGDGHPLYREVQRFRQWWLWLVVLIAAAPSWWVLVQQLILGDPVGDNPLTDVGAWLVWAFVGVGLPLLLRAVTMVTEVTSDSVTIRYRPLTRRVILLADIREATVRTYHPLREYGGWGIKGWSRGNVAYNVNGDRGVQLTLVDGSRVLIGSARPEELARSLGQPRG